jgi:hypothetical protein
VDAAVAAPGPQGPGGGGGTGDPTSPSGPLPATGLPLALPLLAGLTVAVAAVLRRRKT